MNIQKLLLLVILIAFFALPSLKVEGEYQRGNGVPYHPTVDQKRRIKIAKAKKCENDYKEALAYYQKLPEALNGYQKAVNAYQKVADAYEKVLDALKYLSYLDVWVALKDLNSPDALISLNSPDFHKAVKVQRLLNNLNSPSNSKYLNDLDDLYDLKTIWKHKYQGKKYKMTKNEATEATTTDTQKELANYNKARDSLKFSEWIQIQEVQRAKNVLNAYLKFRKANYDLKYQDVIIEVSQKIKKSTRKNQISSYLNLHSQDTIAKKESYFLEDADIQLKNVYLPGSHLEMASDYICKDLYIYVLRDDIFQSSLTAFQGVLSIPKELSTLLHIHTFEALFLNEQGLDNGGLSREWASLMAIQLQVSELSIFKSYKEGFHFRRDGKNKEYAKFCGAFLGLAISKELTLDCRFSGLFYHILTSDPKNIQLSLEHMNLIDTTLYEHFSNLNYTALKKLEDFYKDGHHTKKINSFDAFNKYLIDLAREKTVALHRLDENREISRSIMLTDDEFNDLKYELTHKILYSELKDTIKQFFRGLHIFIRSEKLQLFSIEGLRKKVEGEFSEINDKAFEKWKAITFWEDYTNSETEIEKETWGNGLKIQKAWFWEIIQELSEKKKRDLLQFWTDSRNIPKKLEVIHGGTVNKAPSSHTCFFSLKLPYYKDEVKVTVDGIETIKEAKKIMKEKILEALGGVRVRF